MKFTTLIALIGVSQAIKLRQDGAGGVTGTYDANMDQNAAGTNPAGAGGIAGTYDANMDQNAAGTNPAGAGGVAGTYDPNMDTNMDPAKQTYDPTMDAAGNISPANPNVDPANMPSPPPPQDGPSAWDIIDQCDQDGDQMLTQKEGLDCLNAAAKQDAKKWNSLKKWLKKNAGNFDADGNDKLDVFELEDGMNAYFTHEENKRRMEAAMSKAREIIGHCDSNDDNQLEMAEATACLNEARENDDDGNAWFWDNLEQKIQGAFETADSNGNGKLSRKELGEEIMKGGDDYRHPTEN